MSAIQRFPVSGSVAPGFEAVQAAFEANFTRRGEVGAALHVTIDNESVVDLWGGAADAAQIRPWTAETLVNVWSTTKGWLAFAMHLLASRGLLDFDAPVAYYWPEFGQNGKQDVLIRHLLTHTAGLPGPSMKVPDEALYDWDAMVRALERSELFWRPGTKCGYHAASFGWLNGEVLRRITGVTVGEFLRKEIAGPLNADVYIGLTDAEMARCAETIPFTGLGNFLFQAMLALGGGAKSAKSAAFANPPRPGRAANTRRWREAQIPSSNGHASARGLARLYAPLAQGGRAGDLRLLSPEDVLRAGGEQINQIDLVIGGKVRRSLGFMLSQPETGDARPASAFGHPGMGGSLGYADPEHRLAMGYVMNRMVMGLDARATELNTALYACVETNSHRS